MLGSKFTKFLSVLKQQIGFSSNLASLFSARRHKSFVLKFCIPSTKRAYQSTNLVKRSVSSEKFEILHFGQLLLRKSYNFSAKKVEKCYLPWHSRMMQNLKKKLHVFSNMTWGTWWIYTQPLKSVKISCLEYARFEVRKYRGVIFPDTEQWCKIWINPDLAILKMAWGIGWTFIRVLKSLKNCILICYFFPVHTMFQLENLWGIMCHGTEEWCKI